MGFGCTIVYTGAWLDWKYFLVKVFIRPCGVIRQKQNWQSGCFGKIAFALITLQTFGKADDSVTSRSETCHTPQKNVTRAISIPAERSKIGTG
jgi:hypothetical protein